MEDQPLNSIRMEMYEAETLCAHVDFAKGSGNDCIIDCDGRDILRIFEFDKQLYASGYGTKLVRINRKLLTSRVRLQTDDLLEVPDGAYTLKIIGDERPVIDSSGQRKKQWIFIGVLVLILLNIFAFLFAKKRTSQAKSSKEESGTLQSKSSVSFAETEPVKIQPRPMTVPDDVKALVASPPKIATPLPSRASPDPQQEQQPVGLIELVTHDLQVPLGCIAISPGGRLMAVGGGDGKVRIMDSISGQTIRILIGHDDSISAVAFSANGQQLLSGSYDSTLRLWDVETGKLIHALRGHHVPVRCLAISPDGSTALSGDIDGSVLIWDLKTGENKGWLFGHTRMVNALVFAPDGKRAASGSSDDSVRIWDMATGKAQNVFQELSTGINALAFSSDGKILFSGADGFQFAHPKVQFTKTQTLQEWDSIRGKEVAIPVKIQDWITALSISRDNRFILIATGGDPNMEDGGPSVSMPPFLRLYQLPEWKEIATVRHHEKLITNVAFFPDNDRIVSAGLDGTLRIWTILRK